jgi:hypothetical protein
VTLANARYFVAQLLGPGDAFRKSLLPELYEPVLTNLGNDVLVLRGFEREGEAATRVIHLIRNSIAFPSRERYLADRSAFPLTSLGWRTRSNADPPGSAPRVSAEPTATTPA